MNILPQILKISSKNYLINHFIGKFNNEKEVNYSIFESSTSNMPILSSSSNISHTLHSLIY